MAAVAQARDLPQAHRLTVRHRCCFNRLARSTRTPRSKLAISSPPHRTSCHRCGKTSLSFLSAIRHSATDPTLS